MTVFSAWFGEKPIHQNRDEAQMVDPVGSNSLGRRDRGQDGRRVENKARF
jgi:hypothetical protein